MKKYYFACSNTFPTRCNNKQFIYVSKLLNTFRVVFHPSPGAHDTVSTVSGINRIVTAICSERGWMDHYKRTKDNLVRSTGENGGG